MYGWKPWLPIDIRFRLTSPQAEEQSNYKFLAKLSAMLRWCYELAAYTKARNLCAISVDMTGK